MPLDTWVFEINQIELEKLLVSEIFYSSCPINCSLSLWSIMLPFISKCLCSILILRMQNFRNFHLKCLHPSTANCKYTWNSEYLWISLPSQSKLESPVYEWVVGMFTCSGLIHETAQYWFELFETQQYTYRVHSLVWAGVSSLSKETLSKYHGFSRKYVRHFSFILYLIC